MMRCFTEFSWTLDLQSLRQILDKRWNFGIRVHDVVEFLGKIVADLFNEGKNVVADLVFAVLLLAQNRQGCEDDAFEELQ